MLAAVGSGADDVPDQQPQTLDWHFVDMSFTQDPYDPLQYCAPDDKADYVVAELERLRQELRCAPTEEARPEALKWAVQFVGDIHQLLHTVDEAGGGDDVSTGVRMTGGKSCRGGPCPIRAYRGNFHATGVIQATSWLWAASVERLEAGLLSKAAPGDAGGSIAQWAEETHKAAQAIWNALPATRIADDAYYQRVLSILDQLFALAGLRLARLLNERISIRSMPATLALASGQTMPAQTHAKPARRRVSAVSDRRPNRRET